MHKGYDIKTLKTIKHITIKATRLPIPVDDTALYLTRISGPDAAARVLRTVIDTERDIEQFGALYLDCRNRPIGATLIAIGGRSDCTVDVCQIFRPAIIIGAVSLIVGHNHPSGHAAPSDSDDKLTTRIVSAGELLGITVLDHIVLTATGHASARSP